jgi:translocation and assembly module TamB
LRADGQDLQIIHRITDLQSLVSGLPGSLESRGTLRRSADGVVLDLVTRGPGQIAAKVAGSLDPNLATGDVTIKGTASAAVANGFAAPRSLAGALAYDLRLKGPVGLASLTGTVTLSGGRMADPGQSFGLQDMAAQFVLSGGRIEGSGTTRVSSGGVVSARGTIGLAAPYAANLALSVTGVTLRDPDLYSTRLDGALTLTGPVLGGALLAGTLDLGRTEIRVPSSSLVADGGLPGLQHRGEPGDSRETRAHAGQGQEGAGFAASSGKRGYALDLRINAPAQVFVRGRGLDAELGGRLRLRGRTDAISPEGALGLVRGRLDILGKRLTLSEAQLQMQGRLVPYLRIVADVVSGDILATVEIEGPVDDPEVRFSSSPDLPQEEVVARLLFDRGLENLTAFQALKLASAVASLAGKGGEGLVGNVRRRAGVDNLDIQAGQDGATEVTVGKYLSEKAYTEVTVGDAGTSSISINLDLAPHITLKGRMDSTGESGVGVFLQRDY